jgi:hypothetical protein
MPLVGNKPMAEELESQSQLAQTTKKRMDCYAILGAIKDIRVLDQSAGKTAHLASPTLEPIV